MVRLQPEDVIYIFNHILLTPCCLENVCYTAVTTRDNLKHCTIGIFIQILFSGEQEYSSRVAGMSLGIMLAVLIPVSLIVICFVFVSIKRRNSEIQHDKELNELRFTD